MSGGGASQLRTLRCSGDHRIRGWNGADTDLKRPAPERAAVPPARPDPRLLRLRGAVPACPLLPGRAGPPGRTWRPLPATVAQWSGPGGRAPRRV